MSLDEYMCERAQPENKPYRLLDEQGLYLQITPSGFKSWLLRYTIASKEKSLAFANYPETGLNEAREKAQELREQIEKGKDPSLIKQQAKQLAQYDAAQTLKEVAREWYERELSEWMPKHAAGIWRRLDANIFKYLGHYPIGEITAPMLATCLQRIENRGAYDVANRMLSYLSKIFAYAVATGRAKRNITLDIKGVLKPYKRGYYKAIEVEELQELVKRLKSNSARLYRQTILATSLMLLTFVRTNELMGAKWCEIDFDKAEWIIPSERMKMKLAHVVPLSRQSIVILKEMQGYNGRSEYVFAGVHSWRKPMSNCTILKALDRMGYKGKMTGHGFRALAMSAIKEKIKPDHDVIDRQLAHVPMGTNRAYDRAKYLPERRVMMQQWADYIDMLANRAEEGSAKTVLPLPYMGASIGYAQTLSYQSTQT